MGIDLADKLVEVAGKISTTINEYGDTVYGTSANSACLYRDMVSQVNVPNREDINYDGILWFGPDEDVILGDIYNHETAGYLQIERVIRAKTLVTDNTVQFIKCFVSKQRQVS